MPETLRRPAVRSAALFAAVAFSAAAAVPAARGQAPSPGSTPPAAQAPPAGQIPAGVDLPSGPIQVADVLGILVVGRPEFSGQFRVDERGNVDLPLAGQINVRGKLPTQAAAAVTRALQTRKLVRRPQVTIAIASRAPRVVSISGAVNTSGRTTIKEGTRLNEVLEPAGIGQTADPSRVVITRGDRDITVDYDKFRSGGERSDTTNPVLLDGDRIYVSATPTVIPTGVVRVSGEVKQPAVIPLQGQATVGQVLEQAGGVTTDADRAAIFIQRGNERIPVRYQDILEKKPGADIPLLNEDIVTIPKSEKRQEFTISGAVNAQGTYPITQKTSFLEAIATARGQVEGARLRDTEVTRRLPDGTVKMSKMDLTKPDLVAAEIQPGDVIYVPPARNRRQVDVLTALGGLSSLFFILRR